MLVCDSSGVEEQVEQVRAARVAGRATAQHGLQVDGRAA